MKIFFTLAVSFGLLASQLVCAQLQHFPHGQEILFQKNTLLLRASFDSAYVVSEGFQPQFGMSHQLMENHRIKLPACYKNGNTTLHYVLFDFGLANFSFQSSSDSLSVFEHSTEICRIAKNPMLGDEITLGTLNMTIELRSAYTGPLGADSMWVIKQVGASPGKTPIELHIADKFGWVMIQGTRDHMEQLEHIQSGQVNKSFPVWQDFFPERAGDRKQFKTYLDNNLPNSGMNKGYLDSFISVQITPDTIYRLIKRRDLDSAYRWGSPRELTEKVYADKYPYLQHALKAKHRANPIVHDSAAGFVRFLGTHHNSSNNVWTVNWYDGGYYYYNRDSCQSFQQGISDFFHGEGLNTAFGYTGFNRQALAYWGTNLVAAEVGNNTMGDFKVGVGEIEKPSLDIYPNPSSRNWIIRGLPEPKLPFNLYSSDGKQVQSGILEGNEVWGSDLAPGLYYLVVQSESWTFRHKLIKK